MGELWGVDENVSEDTDGCLVLGIGLEEPCGLFDAFVVSREGSLDELHYLGSIQSIQVNVDLHGC